MTRIIKRIGKKFLPASFKRRLRLSSIPEDLKKSFGQGLKSNLDDVTIQRVVNTRFEAMANFHRIANFIDAEVGNSNNYFELATYAKLLGHFNLAQDFLDKAQELGTNELPKMVSVLLTLRCNAKCVHCWYRNSSEHAALLGSELSAEKFQKILTNSIALKNANLLFSGGEIFLRQDLKDILQAVAENGQTFSLNTNGFFPDRLQLLLSNKVIRKGLKNLAVSLDGPELIHDEIRGKGSFEHLKESLKVAQANDIPCSSQTIIQEKNKNHLTQTAMLSQELGCKYHIFNIEIDGLRAKRFEDVDYIKYLQGWALVLHCCDDHFSGMGCPSGSVKCEIQPDGQVLPCPMVNKRELHGLPWEI